MLRNGSKNTDPDNIYYNANMFNGSPDQVVANYNESRTSPLLYDPSKYYLSVIRFNIPGASLPIFVAQANPFPNTDPNQLIYAVVLTHNDTSSGPAFLQFQPGCIACQPKIPVFSAQNPRQDPTDSYYFVFSYQAFLDMINVALATAYTNLPDKGATTQPPYMTYDAATDLFSLWAEQTYFGNADPFDGSNTLVWFNRYLYNFFPSFQFVSDVASPSTAYAVHIKNNRNNTPAAPAGYYQMVQEYSSAFAWNDLQAISFRSNNIPVLFENQTGISPGGASLQGSFSSNQIAFITDFEPLNSANPGNFRESIQYFPPGEYRLTDLIGTSPLSTIDIQVYWTDKRGTIHPVFILPGQLITLKILFRKKSLYRPETSS